MLHLFEKACVAPVKGRTLVVGSKLYPTKMVDRRKRYEDAVGVDMAEGDGVDLVLNLEEPLFDDVGKFSHIDCLSVLEHSRRPWLLAANLERLLEDGGSIFVAVPFIWRVHGYPDDYWRFTASGIRELFPNIKWKYGAYVHANISREGEILTTNIKGHQYYARTEFCAFGYK